MRPPSRLAKAAGGEQDPCLLRRRRAAGRSQAEGQRATGPAGRQQAKGRGRRSAHRRPAADRAPVTPIAPSSHLRSPPADPGRAGHLAGILGPGHRHRPVWLARVRQIDVRAAGAGAGEDLRHRPGPRNGGAEDQVTQIRPAIRTRSVLSNRLVACPSPRAWPTRAASPSRGTRGRRPRGPGSRHFPLSSADPPDLSRGRRQASALAARAPAQQPRVVDLEAVVLDVDEAGPSGDGRGPRRCGCRAAARGRGPRPRPPRGPPGSARRGGTRRRCRSAPAPGRGRAASAPRTPPAQGSGG